MYHEGKAETTMTESSKKRNPGGCTEKLLKGKVCTTLNECQERGWGSIQPHQCLSPTKKVGAKTSDKKDANLFLQKRWTHSDKKMSLTAKNIQTRLYRLSGGGDWEDLSSQVRGDQKWNEQS